MNTKEPKEYQSERAMSVLAVCLAVGCVIILLYSAQATNISLYLSVVGVALVIALSALLTGGLLGFLFGIPRTLQPEEKSVTQQIGNVVNTSATQKSERSYGVNTNLEDVSDWLTKILVGVGLTQISSVPSALREYADYFSKGLGDYPNSSVFSIALLLFFLIDGFLLSYLWTRLHFAGALRQADAESVLARVDSKLDIIDIDARAWSIVQRSLNLEPGESQPKQEEINTAIASATSHTKEQIFWEAARMRSENWRNLADKPKMERTIPIFYALIASDTEDVHHEYHGQLGYALKDKRNPNCVEANVELTKAIKLRGDWQTSGWKPYYEFARALCQINLDEPFNRGEKSNAEIKLSIQSDLTVASSHPELKELVNKEKTIKKWMEINAVTIPNRGPDLNRI
jgi:hypothetical protein